MAPINPENIVLITGSPRICVKSRRWNTRARLVPHAPHGLRAHLFSISAACLGTSRRADIHPVGEVPAPTESAEMVHPRGRSIFLPETPTAFRSSPDYLFGVGSVGLHYSTVTILVLYSTVVLGAAGDNHREPRWKPPQTSSLPSNS